MDDEEGGSELPQPVWKEHKVQGDELYKNRVRVEYMCVYMYEPYWGSGLFSVLMNPTTCAVSGNKMELCVYQDNELQGLGQSSFISYTSLVAERG